MYILTRRLWDLKSVLSTTLPRLLDRHSDNEARASYLRQLETRLAQLALTLSQNERRSLRSDRTQADGEIEKEIFVETRSCISQNEIFIHVVYR